MSLSRQVLITSNNPDEGRVDKSSITFTSQDWDQPQQIIVRGVNDDIIDGNINYHIILNVSASDDKNFKGIAKDLIFTNYDNDMPQFILTKVLDDSSTSDISELGTTIKYALTLSSPPPPSVTVRITYDTSNRSIATLNQYYLTFTDVNWNQPAGHYIRIFGVNNNTAGNTNFQLIFNTSTSDSTPFNGLTLAPINLINYEAGTSCEAIKTSGESFGNGTYFIQNEGLAFCDMTGAGVKYSLTTNTICNELINNKYNIEKGLCTNNEVTTYFNHDYVAGLNYGYNPPTKKMDAALKVCYDNKAAYTYYTLVSYRWLDEVISGGASVFCSQWSFSPPNTWSLSYAGNWCIPIYDVTCKYTADYLWKTL